MNALQHATEILELHRENEYLRYEVARLREYELKYQELLNESVKHGEQMMCGWLDLLLSGKVQFPAAPSLALSQPEKQS